MGRSFFIITFLVSFLAGVGLHLVVHPSFFGLLSLSVICLFCFFKKSQSLAYLFIISLAFGLSLGFIRAQLSIHQTDAGQVDFYNGSSVQLEGWVRQVDVRKDKAKYTIASQKLVLQDSSQSDDFVVDVSGDVLISVGRYPRYEYGDKVILKGKLETPGLIDDFSYSDYLSRYGIYSVMYSPAVKVVGSGEGYFFWRCMTAFQNGFISRINRLFPEPHASFEAGLLVGARKGIPDDLMEKFNTTGLTHIIAISGYNITIIIVFVMWMFKGLARRTRFVMAVICIVLFTLFVGASPAVVRASIMGILGLMALQFGRQNNIHLTLLFSAFFMVLWNPKILWWDVGFQLSFAAVLGLIYAAGLFERFSKMLPEAFGIREAIFMTLSAQVFALPIIIYQFGRLSLVAPLANLLVAFAIPPAMLLGFLAVLFSFLSYTLAALPAYLTWGILSYIIGVVRQLSSIPYASADITGFRFWMMAGYYGLLVLFLFFMTKIRRKNVQLELKD